MGSSDKNKLMTDADIMAKLLHELRYSALAFSKKLEYKSHSSIDHILKGKNQISESLMDKIIKDFPEVNYWFLKKGQMPIILDEKLKQNQANLFGTLESKPLNYDLEVLNTLKRIEGLLTELVNKK
jgi:hypothetical protein